MLNPQPNSNGIPKRTKNSLKNMDRTGNALTIKITKERGKCTKLMIRAFFIVEITLLSKLTYEFRYFINDNGIFGAFRKAPDDHGTNHAGYTESKDGGKTWNTTIYADGVQSRHDIINTTESLCLSTTIRATNRWRISRECTTSAMP